MWRIRKLRDRFVQLEDLGPDTPIFTAKRQVWRCGSCAKLFALVRVPEKDEQDYLVRPSDDDWRSWDWAALVEATTRAAAWGGEASGEAKIVL